MPDGALQREVTHRHGRPGVVDSHLRQRLPDVGSCQLAKFPGADDLEDRLKDVLVLLDRFGRAAVEAIREPVLCGLAHGVVCVAGLPDDPLVEFVMQFP
jgi:hypothetical protein